MFSAITSLILVISFLGEGPPVPVNISFQYSFSHYFFQMWHFEIKAAINLQTSLTHQTGAFSLFLYLWEKNEQSHLSVHYYHIVCAWKIMEVVRKWLCWVLGQKTAPQNCCNHHKSRTKKKDLNSGQSHSKGNLASPTPKKVKPGVQFAHEVYCCH